MPKCNELISGCFLIYEKGSQICPLPHINSKSTIFHLLFYFLDYEIIPAMYRYPRIAIVEWNNHHRAAFYPPSEATNSYPTILDDDGHVPDHLTSKAIAGFVKRYLRNPDVLMEETEHF